ncbi:MAG: beta-galactosidase, partial [bacterium]
FNGAGDVPLFGFSLYTHNLLSIFPSYSPAYARIQWSLETINRYKRLGFNTLGNWSDDGLNIFQDNIPYTVAMNFIRAVANNFGSNNCPVVNKGYWDNFPDVFDQRFYQNAIEYARQKIAPGYIQDPWLIGYFIDNEINWFGGAQFLYNPDHTLADDFIGLPSAYAGKQYWVNTFLRQKLGYTIEKLDQLYGTTFTEWTDVLNITELANNPMYPQIQKDKQAFIYDIASTYFSVTNIAIKSVDPNHLNLCARFASDAPDQVIEAASQYCDIISVNDYYTLDNPISNAALGDPVKRWTRFFSLSMLHNTYGKPFIQSEFGIRAQDSGLPNTKGAGWTVKTQYDRVAYYRNDINRLLGIELNGLTFVAGFHWFEWSDEPATGRFDGENSNYGFVNIKDEPYLIFFSNIANTTRTLMS